MNRAQYFKCFGPSLDVKISVKAFYKYSYLIKKETPTTDIETKRKRKLAPHQRGRYCTKGFDENKIVCLFVWPIPYLKFSKEEHMKDCRK